MSKFRVHFESSAAIGIEIEVEAENIETAERIAQRMLDKGDFKPQEIVEELFTIPDMTIEAYAESTGTAITHITVEEDENGFEIVDSFVAESVEEDGRPNKPRKVDPLREAAPKMLTALKNLREMIRTGILKGDGKHDVTTQADAAIADAEGCDPVVLAVTIKEFFFPLADLDAWAEFWRINGETMVEIGDEETCLALAKNCNLLVGGGAAPMIRVGFVD